MKPPRLQLTVLTGFLLFSCFLAEAISAPAKKRFDLPTGPAAVSLKQFILQSGVQLLYVAEEVSGVTTNTVKGEFTSGDAVKRLLANTVLQAVEMENGAIAINRSSDPNGHRVAQESERDHPKPQTNPKLISRFPTP